MRRVAMLILALATIAAMTGARGALADQTTVTIGFLSQWIEAPPALSNLDDPPEDEGRAGAELAIQDNASTGRFLGQDFALDAVEVAEDGDVVDALRQMVARGARLIALDLPAQAVEAVAKSPDAKGVLLFNGRAGDDTLRGAACAANLLHTAPSRAMLADGLAQYLMLKRWSKWFLITGPRAEDALYAAAIKRAAKRFGAKIVAEKTWTEDHDARRTAQAEVPVFTQGASYDVVVVADEIGDFGDYLMYRTWDPRPVVGTQGLVPTNWHRAHEQWGAAQLQSRFKRKYGRWMTPRDHGAWLAVRAVGEAATRTKSTDPDKITTLIRNPDFAFAGFKGVPLSFRPWDGQLRQPILLAADRSMVAVAPVDGFLHPVSPLDTLGEDKPETRCRAGG